MGARVAFAPLQYLGGIRTNGNPGYWSPVRGTDFPVHLRARIRAHAQPQGRCDVKATKVWNFAYCSDIALGVGRNQGLDWRATPYSVDCGC